ncbi:MAG: prephenate dehydrogenase/arogenate dehydrogenase family protein [Eubacteriales bacterium]
MSIKKIGIIGLGLIGGSIAKTIRFKKLPIHIIACDTNSANLKRAQNEGIINEYTMDVNESFESLDIIFLCAPVQNNNKLLAKIKSNISSTCILTDVGSVKGMIHRAITDIGLENNFIGGHPMAGSEKSGYQAANEHLFENAYYVLTPCSAASKTKVSLLYDFIESLGAIPLTLDSNNHDYATAAISHIPHIIASSLVNLVKDIDKNDLMKQLAAGGFKDITRIASSSPNMWKQISLCNKDKIQEILEKYIDIIFDFKQKLLDDNEAEIYNFFANANEYRSTFSDPSLGLIKKSYEVMVDIPDEPGVIAKIATILSGNNINIKNIGIIHNREFEEGVLKIIFYDEESQANSIKTLKTLNYTIYTR